MPAPLNITNLPGARQPVTNNDGTMDRVWYRFFFNLFNLTGAGSSDTSITDLLITPSLETVDDIAGQQALQEVGSLPPVTDLGAVYAALQSLNEQPQPPDLGPVLVALDGLSMAPSSSGGSLTSITAGTGLTASPSPITSSGSLSLANTAVTPASYTFTNLTVDAQGRITAASNGSAARAAYKDGSVPGGNTVANTVTETAFASTTTFAANTLAVGSVIRLSLTGVFSSTLLSPTLTGKVKLGGATVLNTGALTIAVGAANNGWTATGLFIVTAIGATGSVEIQGYAEFATAATTSLSVNVANTAPFTIDTTASLALTVTVQWGTASASNTITLRQMLVELL